MERRQARRGTGDAQAVRQARQEIGPSSFASPREGSRVRAAGALHVCPACASELVYPVNWEAADRRRWSVSLRCPECDWTGGGIYGQAAVDRFDEALDRATESMLEDLRALARANMEDRIDRFAAALEADRILPEDF